MAFQKATLSVNWESRVTLGGDSIFSEFSGGVPVLNSAIYGTSPVVIHCPGMGAANGEEKTRLMARLMSSPNPKVKAPGNASLVTWNNGPDKSPLERQCLDMELPLTVLGNGIKDWRNGLKGPLLVDFAKSSKDEFVIAIDSRDARIQGDLSECVEALVDAGCDVLFGSEMGSYPSNPKWELFEAEKYKPPFRYLNSGMMVARRDFLASLPKLEWGKSDQGVWRGLHMSLWPRIRLDDQCRVFMNINLPNHVSPEILFRTR